MRFLRYLTLLSRSAEPRRRSTTTPEPAAAPGPVEGSAAAADEGVDALGGRPDVPCPTEDRGRR